MATLAFAAREEQTFTVGQYVSFKGTTYIVVKLVGNNCQLLNPLKGNAKIVVNPRNLSVTRYRPAKVVRHNSADYLVTAKGLIISLTTGRVMQWDETNGDRSRILAAAA